MLTIPGYEIHEKLYEGTHSLIFRALRKEDGKRLIIKLLKDERPSLETISRFKREYEINRSIAGEEAAQVCVLEKVGQTYAMILEDRGGRSVDQILALRKLSLRESLDIAIQIVNELVQIHGKPIIHKDINPSNIIWNPEAGKAQLIDFGISSTLSREKQEVKAPHFIEGTLAYISPEQTGRMNREVDKRTDFYSLGCSLYQMLTGVLPFQSDDPMELIHFHMAKQPEAPHILNPEIPPIVSEIVLKLMAKTAEDRYQSAQGLRYDLMQCLDALDKKGKIDLFSLGTHDISDRFEISGKFYGRKNELAQLLQTFELVCQGEAHLLLVAGSSGIGKTALIREIQKPMIGKRGFFIAGKCEQFKRDTPHWGIVQALGDWVEQIVREGEATIASWKETLLAAVGTNGGVITHLVPAFEPILGKQSKPLPLGPAETQERFNLVFVKFLQALATPDHPLVLFLDDLQWAEPATLRLLKAVLLHPDTKYLLLLGSYRDNEPTSETIAKFVQEELKKTDFASQILNLSALPLSDLLQMMADTLQALPDQVQPLAELCHSRSGGNPFIFIELLKYLNQNQLIHFNADRERWEWNLEQIQREGMTKNAAELMSYQIEKMGPAAQETLQIASCIGFYFDLYTLAHVYNKSPQDTLKDLWEAIQKDLISPEKESYKYILYQEGLNQNARFHFVHDHIQKSANDRLSSSKKREIHDQIGQFLLKNQVGAKLEENIFLIADHFNLSETLASPQTSGDKRRRLRLLRLNFLAGKVAQNNSAFNTGVGYLQLAREKLRGDSWEKEYKLSLAILKSLSECLYSSGQSEEAFKLIQELLTHAKTDLEKADIYTGQGKQLVALGLVNEAIDCGILGLKLFDIEVSKTPSKGAILQGLLQARWSLGRRSIPSLLDEPRMTSARNIKIIKLMSMIWSSAYYSGNMPLVALMAIHCTNISLKYGNHEESAVAYAIFGSILHSKFNSLKNGAAFLKLAVAINEKFNDLQNRSYVYYIYALFGVTFEKNWKSLREAYDQVIEAGLKVGDMSWPTIACMLALIWDPEMPRDVLLEESKKYEKIINPEQFHIAWIFFKIAVLYHANLAGKTNDQFSLSTPYFDEALALEELKKVRFNSAIAVYHMRKGIIYFTYDTYGEALQEMQEASKKMTSLEGTAGHTDFCFYFFLVQVATFEKLPGLKKVSAYFTMRKYLRKMKVWAKFCPTNFLHKQLLMEAELARLEGRRKRASKLYEKAIECAKKYEFLNIEALAKELAAKFYLDSDQSSVARMLLVEACYAYYKFGAERKLQALMEKYPEMLSQVTLPTAIATSLTLPVTQTSRALTSKSLDYDTAIKASQTISSEIVFDKFIKKMMAIILENAGAEKGWLILEKNKSWTVVAEATFNEVQIVSKPLDTLPVTLINSVIYNKTPAVFSNPSWFAQFARDAYIQRVHPKAVLCMPLLNRSHLSGILYLENNLTKDAFTPNRLEVLNLIGSQIAISMDNAQLYSDMMSLNKNLQTLNEALARFIPHEFLDILGKKSIAEVGIGDSVEREMTVLFADIRGFTSRSEKMTPQDSFKFINDFLNEMVPVIQKHSGFIDKFLGDGFMAIFPTDADTALQAAISMVRTLKDYNSKKSESIQMGIGLNSGKVMLGTVGEKSRLEETVISDVVNTASRLQNETKVYGAALLISNETYARLKTPEHYDLRPIDQICLRGKSEPVLIYEVFETDLPEVILRKRESRANFERALSFYREGHYAEALPLLDQIVQHNPEDLPAAYLLSAAREKSQKRESI